MQALPPHSSPRNYPAMVTIRRRSARGPAAAPATSTTQGVSDWLLCEALREGDMLCLYEQFVWRLVKAGFPLERSSLHVGTLHPQLLGFAWVWERQDEVCDELQIPQSILGADAYRLNPLVRVIENGEKLNLDPRRSEVCSRYPLMAELAEQGFTNYVARPLSASGSFHNAFTIATKHPDGFTAEQLAAFDEMLRAFALHVERHIAIQISANILETYLGRAAGRQVLDGSINRGTGEAIQAVIWFSDLRGSTELGERMSGSDMTRVLNAYFETLATSVMSHGGEVLKFIGDGLLAVFPIASLGGERAAARAATHAAQEALDRLNALNDDPRALAGISGWRPLRTGIALHEGDVFFGNVGAPDRLDFTVVGTAVNEASRVEALCKSLDRELLMTARVARHLDEPLQPLGSFPLPGLETPLGVYGMQTEVAA